MMPADNAITMPAIRVSRTGARAVRISAESAQRQFLFSLWLVALLGAATILTATVGIFA